MQEVMETKGGLGPSFLLYTPKGGWVSVLQCSPFPLHSSPPKKKKPNDVIVNPTDTRDAVSLSSVPCEEGGGGELVSC